MTAENKYPYVSTKREDIDEIPEKWAPLVKKIIRNYTRFNVWVYKKSGGKLLKNFPGGYPICIVGMKGRKSGARREVALINLPWNDNGVEKKLVIASQGGMDTHPVWYHNIKANPNIDIMVTGVTKNYVAEQISEEAKAELWPHILSLYPDFDEYQARTDRAIPVFVCSPV